jgi:hypothetical protein
VLPLRFAALTGSPDLMIRISFLRPIDPFDGTRRFLQELQACLAPDLKVFRFEVVVFWATRPPALT